MICYFFIVRDDVIIIENIVQAYRSLKAFLDDTDRKIEVLKEKLEEKQKEINADIEDKEKVQENCLRLFFDNNFQSLKGEWSE